MDFLQQYGLPEESVDELRLLFETCRSKSMELHGPDDSLQRAQERLRRSVTSLKFKKASALKALVQQQHEREADLVATELGEDDALFKAKRLKLGQDVSSPTAAEPILQNLTLPAHCMPVLPPACPPPWRLAQQAQRASSKQIPGDAGGGSQILPNTGSHHEGRWQSQPAQNHE